MNKQPWWMAATGYQIYPRSFCDSNGDGVGDIPGITSKLDHLSDLGISFIWLSPVYASPMKDNGYDIADYYDIAPEFGTLDDFDQLVAEANQRGICIVMDLVVNHCSSDHAWFKKARSDENCPEHDYFYWRPPNADGGPPDDQRACFGGSAWTWVETVGKYCYCHFGSQQPDLNWHNPDLRTQIYTMMNWWLDKGIGGFRMDVIDLVGKDIDARIYFEGPQMLEFLQEMHQECLAGRDVVTVGETWSARPDTALKYCGQEHGALSMVFSFNHIEAMWNENNDRFGPKVFDLVTHKRILAQWQSALQDEGWNSLFLSNHDLPRPVSYLGNDDQYRVRSAKMLAMVHYLMKGTAFVYQGEEIGMTNAYFSSLDQYRDIETLGQLQERLGPEGSNRRNQDSIDAFLENANLSGRDNARTPMQWNSGPTAGFTTGTPWIDINENSSRINVETDKQDPDGVFAFYQRLIQIRQDIPAISRGTYQAMLEDDPFLFAYKRDWDGGAVVVIGNFTDKVVDVSNLDLPHGAPLISTIVAEGPVRGKTAFAPFEGHVWIIAADEV